jgi:hypothetical protein
MIRLLDSVDDPKALRRLPRTDLPQLARELRQVGARQPSQRLRVVDRVEQPDHRGVSPEGPSRGTDPPPTGAASEASVGGVSS